MSKSIRAVLVPDEIKRIEDIQAGMKDPHYAAILEKIYHIECGINDGGTRAIVYESSANPFTYLIHKKDEKPQKHTEEALRIIRADHLKNAKVKFTPRSILANEMNLRTKDIMIHKYYLSQTEQHDVGIVVASAHWLKDISPKFYEQSETHHKQQGEDFEWLSMERAVVIAAPNRDGKVLHYVLVNRGDLLCEENLAQYAAGVAKDDERVYSLAAALREKLAELHHIEHFCILEEPKAFDYPCEDARGLNPPGP